MIRLPLKKLSKSQFKSSSYSCELHQERASNAPPRVVKKQYFKQHSKNEIPDIIFAFKPPIFNLLWKDVGRNGTSPPSMSLSDLTFESDPESSLRDEFRYSLRDEFRYPSGTKMSHKPSDANVADEFELSTIPFAIPIERKPPEFKVWAFPNAAEPKSQAARCCPKADAPPESLRPV
jgi:hypothetical protein